MIGPPHFERDFCSGPGTYFEVRVYWVVFVTGESPERSIWKIEMHSGAAPSDLFTNQSINHSVSL